MSVPATTTNQANLIYAKIDNPMTAIAELGKMFQQSQIMGISTPGDGAVLALTCMCEGITPLEFARTYHIINGRPSMRADMMSAKFRAAGGKVKWIDLGDEGKKAEAEFTFDGQTLKIGYTIDDARAVVGDKVDKAESNWKKDRGAMLRARLTTKAVRIMAPELIAGVYTPEELEDITTPPGVAPPTQETLKKREVRRKELTESATVPADVIIDVVPEAKAEPKEPAKTASTNAEPLEDDGNLPATSELLKEAVAVGSLLPSPSNPDPDAKMTLKEIAEGICSACGVSSPQQATRRQMREIIKRFRDKLASQ